MDKKIAKAAQLIEDILSRPGGNELLDLGNIYRSLTLCSAELVNPLTSEELVKLTERIYETRYLSGTPVMMDERVDAVRFMLEYGISPNRSPEFSSLSADKTRELLSSCDMEVFVDLVDAVAVDGYEYYGRDFYLDAEAMDRLETAIHAAKDKPASLDSVVRTAEAIKEASAGGRGAAERGVEDTVVR